MSKYSIVIPIKKYTYFWSGEGIDNRKPTREHDNIKRFFEISWKTHDKYMKKEDIDCIYFILPQDEKEYFESMANKYIKNVNIKILVDDDLISQRYNFKSHRKQMLLKLAIHQYINTDLYLILDEDIITLKEFGHSDLYDSNKVKYTSDPNIMNEVHVWESSRDLLKLKTKTNIYKLKDVIAITPQIMITAVVKQMMDYLLKQHGSEYNLYEEMTKVSWTEYTLYWLYLRYVDQIGKKRYKDSRIIGRCLTSYESDYIEIIRNTIKEKEGYFMIIQSNVYEYNIKNLKKAFN